MTRPACFFSAARAALIAALLAGGGGYLAGQHQGQAQGALSERAARDAQAVEGLTQLIDSHRGLIAQADTASQTLRQALARRAQSDAQTTKEFRDALAATADRRTGCVFDSGLMRQLTEARDRAAQAAAGGAAAGARGTLPGPGGAAGPGR